MPCLTTASLAATEARRANLTKGSVARASSSVPSPYGGRLYGRDNSELDRRLYRSLKETVFSAVRPIAVRYAGKPIRVAALPKAGRKGGVGAFHKELKTKGYANPGLKGFADEQRRRQRLATKAMLPQNAVLLDDHEALDLLRRPNNVMGQWATMFSVASSVMVTGHALLAWGNDGVYYIPMHWATPIHRNGLFSQWEIRPPDSSHSYTLDQGQFVYIKLPNPEDPIAPISPVIASRRQINLGEKISEAHWHSLENLTNPRLAVGIGRPSGPGGTGSRPALSRNQRKVMTRRIKDYLQGAHRNGEILVLDGIIDSIQEIGAAGRDLDFRGGAGLVEERILQTFGTSPVVAGVAGNANRAGSIIATEVFDENVVNPLLIMSGDAFTHSLGPVYSTRSMDIILYHEESRAHDPDASSRRVSLFPDSLSVEEQRRFIRTGETDWEDADIPERVEPQRGEPITQRPAVRA